MNTTSQKIVGNIQKAARLHPLVVQSLWMRVNGGLPAETELDGGA